MSSIIRLVLLTAFLNLITPLNSLYVDVYLDGAWRTVWEEHASQLPLFAPDVISAAPEGFVLDSVYSLVDLGKKNSGMSEEVEKRLENKQMYIGNGGEIEDGMINGTVGSSAYISSNNPDSNNEFSIENSLMARSYSKLSKLPVILQRQKLHVDELAARVSLISSSAPPMTNEREKVRVIAKLNKAIQDPIDYADNDVYEDFAEIFEDGLNEHGGSTDTVSLNGKQRAESETLASGTPLLSTAPFSIAQEATGTPVTPPYDIDTYLSDPNYKFSCAFLNGSPAEKHLQYYGTVLGGIIDNYNYCGPGTRNSLRSYGSQHYIDNQNACSEPLVGTAPYDTPINELDQCCYQHDLDYTAIMEAGKWPPPLEYEALVRAADETFLDCANRVAPKYITGGDDKVQAAITLIFSVAAFEMKIKAEDANTYRKVKTKKAIQEGKVFVYRSTDGLDKKIVVFKEKEMMVTSNLKHAGSSALDSVTAELEAGWVSHKLKQSYYSNWESGIATATAQQQAQYQYEEAIGQAKLLAHAHLHSQDLSSRTIETYIAASDKTLKRNHLWPIYKQILTDIKAQSNIGTIDATTLMLTGYGASAPMTTLISMWQKKSISTAYNTYIFGGVGTQCGLQKDFLPGTFATDIDTSDVQTHITSFVHQLDVVGSIDYPIGKKCIFGTSDTVSNAASSKARNFCAKIVGFNGADLFLSEGRAKILFKQCLYYTHMLPSIVRSLNLDTVLIDTAATTDGGCVAAATQSAIVTGANKASTCAPCMDSYDGTGQNCGVTLPRLPLSWEFYQKYMDGISPSSQLPVPSHPCLASAGQSIPNHLMATELSTVQKNSALFKNAFSKCIYLGGGKNDYMLIGSNPGFSGIANSYSGAYPQLNINFQYTLLGKQLAFQTSLFLQKLTTVGGAAFRYRVFGLYSLADQIRTAGESIASDFRGGEETVMGQKYMMKFMAAKMMMSAQQNPFSVADTQFSDLFDVELTPDQKSCSSIMQFDICLSAVSNKIILSAGFASTYGNLQKGLSFAVGRIDATSAQFFTGTNVAPIPDLVTLASSTFTQFPSVSEVTTAFNVATTLGAAGVLPSVYDIIDTANHPCIAGSSAANKNSLTAMFDKHTITGSPATDFCLVVGELAGLKIEHSGDAATRLAANLASNKPNMIDSIKISYVYTILGVQKTVAFYVDLINEAEGSIELAWSRIGDSTNTRGKILLNKIINGSTIAKNSQAAVTAGKSCLTIPPNLQYCFEWGQSLSTGKTVINAWLQGAAFYQSTYTSKSNKITIFDYTTPHPCLIAGYVAGSDAYAIKKSITVPVGVDQTITQAIRTCTALGPNSFVQTSGNCTGVSGEEGNCGLNMTMVLDKSAYLTEDDNGGRRNLLLSAVEEGNAEDISRQLAQSQLSIGSLSSLVDNTTESFDMQLYPVTSNSTSVRVVARRYGIVYFDVDLTANTTKCVGISGKSVFCVERSDEGSYNNDTGVFTPSSSRRRLVGNLMGHSQGLQTIIALSVLDTVTQTKRILPLAQTRINGGLMLDSFMNTNTAWLTAPLDSNIIGALKTGSVVTDAAAHDECRDNGIVDTACDTTTEECYSMADPVNQNNCFPKLHLKPKTTESTTWFQQLTKLTSIATLQSKSSANGVNSNNYDEPKNLASTGTGLSQITALPENWSTRDYWCLDKSTNTGSGTCVTVFTKPDPSLTTPTVTDPKICVVDFQGSEDDESDILAESESLKLGVTLVNGFHVHKRYAQIFRKLQSHIKYPEIYALTRNALFCKQVYWTGHHLGAALAILQRLTVSFGRVFTISGPNVFPQYSYPKHCSFGDSFHFQDDPGRFFPVGFRSGGMRVNTICSSDNDIGAGASSSVVIQTYSCGDSGYMKDATLGINSCAYNQIERYENYISNDTIFGETGVSNNVNFNSGSCPNINTQKLINTCLNRYCSAPSSASSDALSTSLRGTSGLSSIVDQEDLDICALGPEALATQLAIESKRADLTGIVTSLPKFYSKAPVAFDYLNNHISSTAKLGREVLPALTGSVSDPKLYLNGLPTSADQYSQQYVLGLNGLGSGSTVTFKAEPGIDTTSAKLTMELSITGLPSDVPAAVANTVSVANPLILQLISNIVIAPDPHVNTLKVTIGSPQISTHLPGVGEFSYRVTLGAFFCRSLEYFPASFKVCFVFGGTALELRLFLQDTPIAYKKTLATVDLQSKTIILLPSDNGETQNLPGGNDRVQIGKYGEYAYGSPQDIENEAWSYTNTVTNQVSSGLYREITQLDNDIQSFCAVLVPGGVSCTLDSDCTGSATGSICLQDKNICGCPIDTCMNLANTACVPSNSAGALREIQLGHPCLGKEYSDPNSYNLYEVYKDVSDGSPWERCVPLSAKSYMRLDYTQLFSFGSLPNTPTQPALQMMVTTGIHIGFQVLKGFYFDRTLTFKINIIEITPGNPGAQITVHDDTVIGSDPSNRGTGPVLASYPVPVTNKDRLCVMLTAPVSLGAAPIADLCVKSAPQLPTIAGNVVTTRIQTYASICVPVLLNQCKQVRVADVVKTETGRRRILLIEDEDEDNVIISRDTEVNDISSHRRQLTTTVAYSVEPVVVSERVSIQDDEDDEPEEEKILGFSIPVAMFLGFAIFLLMSIPISFVLHKCRKMSGNKGLNNENGELDYDQDGLALENQQRGLKALADVTRESRNEMLQQKNNNYSGGSGVSGNGFVRAIRASVGFGGFRNNQNNNNVNTSATNNNIGIESEQFSGLSYARKHAGHDFSGTERGKKMLSMSSWIPPSRIGRFFTCFAYPLHIIRVWATFQVPLRNLPIFPDEKADLEKLNKNGGGATLSIQPVIRKFLCWRRSMLISFVGFSGMLLIITSMTEFPPVVENLIESNESTTEKDIQNILEIAESVDSASAETPASQNAMDNEIDINSGKLLRKLSHQRIRVLSGTSQSRFLEEFKFSSSNDKLSESLESDYDTNAKSNMHYKYIPVASTKPVSRYYTQSYFKNLAEIHEKGKGEDFNSLVNGFGGDTKPRRSYLENKKRKLSKLSNSINNDKSESTPTSRQLQAATSAEQAQERLDQGVSQLSDILIVSARLREFKAFMAIRNFLICITVFISCAQALRSWTQYQISSKYIMAGFGFRLLIITAISFFPWFKIIFPEGYDLCDESSGYNNANRSTSLSDSSSGGQRESADQFCKSILLPARIYIDAALNLPVISLAFMVTPGILAGAVIVMEILPFTLMPYFVIAVVPLLVVVIAIWPILSIIAHGLDSFLILIGSVSYVFYAIVTVWASVSSIVGLDAFRDLGREVWSRNINKNKDISTGNELDDMNIKSELDIDNEANKDNQMITNATGAITLESIELMNQKLNGATDNTQSPPPTNNNIVTGITTDVTQALVNNNQIQNHSNHHHNEDVDVSFGSANSSSEDVDSQSHLNQNAGVTLEKLKKLDPESQSVGECDPDVPDIENKTLLKTAVGNTNNTTKNLNTQQQVEEFKKQILQHSAVTVSPSPVAKNVEEKQKRSKEKDLLDKILDAKATKASSGENINNFDFVTSQFLSTLSSGNNTSSDDHDMVSKDNAANLRIQAKTEDALVQGTLARHLATKAKANVGKWMMRALLFQLTAYVLFFIAILTEGEKFIEINFSADLLGGCMMGFVDAIVNRCNVELITIDFLLDAMVKLRLYNGYMHDDTDLTNLSVLFRFSQAVNRMFREGVEQGRKETQEKAIKN